MSKKMGLNFGHLIFILFKMFGLAPFSTVMSRQNKPKLMKFRHSRIGISYNIALLLALFPSTGVAIYLIMSRQTSNWQNVEGVLEIMNIVGAWTSLSVILITYCLKQNSMVLIFNQLTSLANRFEIQSHRVYSFPRRKHTKISIISIHVLFSSAILIYGTVKSPLDLYTFIYYISGSGAIFSLGLFMVQYAIVLSFLEDGYENLNLSLESLPKINEKELRDRIDNVPIVPSNGKWREKLLFIQNTRRILCEVSYQISDIFGWAALMTITYYSVKLIFDTYLVMLNVIFTTSPLTTLQIIMNIVFVMKDAYPMIVLTVYGTRVSEQTKRSSAIVHKMMAECSVDMNLMKYQLQQFSMELLHQGEISFTACGFFAIDGTLLKSIISTTITYMVILLQYMQAK